MANQTTAGLGADIASGTKKKQKDDDDSGSSDAWSTGAKIGQKIGSNIRDRSKAKSTLKSAKAPTSGLDTTQQAVTSMIPSFKHGGRVKKTGLAYVHRGEHVIPAGKKTKIIASQAREPVPTGKHGKHKRITKIIGSPAKR